MSNQSRYPAGWDEARVQKVLAHYEIQTEEEAVAEDEAALAHPNSTLMPVPLELVPTVQQLIAEHEAKQTVR
jgi:hypothetical protein